MNKLGFYIQVYDRTGLREAIEQVKPPTILYHRGGKGLLIEIRQRLSPDSFIIGRWEELDPRKESILYGSDPEGAGRVAAREILNYDPYDPAYATGRVNGKLLVDAWMTLNESLGWPSSGEDMAAFEQKARNIDAFQVAFRQELMTRGIEAVAFNFGAGNFDLPEKYLRYFPRTLESYKYLGFHEYGWPTLKPPNSGALFYRRCMDGIRRVYGNRHEVIITEAGVTRMYGGRRSPDEGWLSREETLSEDQYWESLEWYNAELCRDDYVKGACLFQVGDGFGGGSFRHLGVDNDSRPIRLMDRIAALRTTPQPIPQPTPQPTPQPPDLAALLKAITDQEARLTPIAGQLAGQGAQATGLRKPLDDAAQIVVAAGDQANKLAGAPPRLQKLTLDAGRASAASALQKQTSDLQRQIEGAAELAKRAQVKKKELAALVTSETRLPGLLEQIKRLLAQLKELRESLEGGPEPSISLQHPVPGKAVSRNFGAPDPVYLKAGFKGHEGVDFSCVVGTPVLAAAGGVVWRSGQGAPDNPWGTRIILQHDWNGQRGYTVYAHLSEVEAAAAQGAQVAPGQLIGKSGNTGQTTAPHLHFCLALSGVVNDGYLCPSSMGAAWFFDPVPYISGGVIVGPPMRDDDLGCVPPSDPI